MTDKSSAVTFLQRCGLLRERRICSRGHDTILSLTNPEDRWRCRRSGCESMWCQRVRNHGPSDRILDVKTSEHPTSGSGLSLDRPGDRRFTATCRLSASTDSPFGVGTSTFHLPGISHFRGSQQLNPNTAALGESTIIPNIHHSNPGMVSSDSSANYSRNTIPVRSLHPYKSEHAQPDKSTPYAQPVLASLSYIQHSLPSTQLSGHASRTEIVEGTDQGKKMDHTAQDGTVPNNATVDQTVASLRSCRPLSSNPPNTTPLNICTEINGEKTRFPMLTPMKLQFEAFVSNSASTPTRRTSPSSIIQFDSEVQAYRKSDLGPARGVEKVENGVEHIPTEVGSEGVREMTSDINIFSGYPNSVHGGTESLELSSETQRAMESSDSTPPSTGNVPVTNSDKKNSLPPDQPDRSIDPAYNMHSPALNSRWDSPFSGAEEPRDLSNSRQNAYNDKPSAPEKGSADLGQSPNPFTNCSHLEKGHSMTSYSEAHSSAEDSDEGMSMARFEHMANSAQPDHAGVYFCHLCDFTGRSRQEFQDHLRSHYDYKCLKCDYTSRTEGRLKRHLKDFHSEVPPENFSGKAIKSVRPKLQRCKQCDFMTETKDEFWRHLRVHIKEDKRLECSICCFVTEYKHHLEYHMRNHMGSKPYKCPKCNYECVNKSMLNSHMKSHSNVYPYRCANCHYATKYCHSLKLHLVKHLHKPAVVLNADGSLPSYDNTAELMSLRRGSNIRRSNSIGGSLLDVSDTNSSHSNLYGEKDHKDLKLSDQFISSPGSGRLPLGHDLVSANGMEMSPSCDLSKSAYHPSNFLAPYPPIPTNWNGQIPTFPGFMIPTPLFSSPNLFPNFLGPAKTGCYPNYLSPGTGSDSRPTVPSNPAASTTAATTVSNIPAVNSSESDMQALRIGESNHFAPLVPIPNFPFSPHTNISVMAAFLAAVQQGAVSGTRGPPNSSISSLTSLPKMDYSITHGSSVSTSRRSGGSNDQEISPILSSSSNSSGNDVKATDLSKCGEPRSGVRTDDSRVLSGPSCKVNTSEGCEMTEFESLNHPSEIALDLSSKITNSFLPGSANPRNSIGKPSNPRLADAEMEEPPMAARSQDTDSARPRIQSAPSSNDRDSLFSEQVRLDDEPVSVSLFAYECRYCEIRFNHRALYDIHMGFHSHSDPYLCNRCGHQSHDPVDFFIHLGQMAHHS
ncbi:unnamed protein product [Calicophoron daubneyi]|uniref:C2H2-type domain-containing protein n=1 Tax=Calicophoron daubneyi TaxID=300641 RepID=A0AAV2TWB1_CALDB